MGKAADNEPASSRLMSSAHVLRLKRTQNWCVHRDLYITKGFELRAEFDAQKLVTNPSVVEKLVSDGEAKLVDMAHPSPYTLPTMPGGTKYQRHPNNNLGWSPEVRNIPNCSPQPLP